MRLSPEERKTLVGEIDEYLEETHDAKECIIDDPNIDDPEKLLEIMAGIDARVSLLQKARYHIRYNRVQRFFIEIIRHFTQDSTWDPDDWWPTAWYIYDVDRQEEVYDSEASNNEDG